MSSIVPTNGPRNGPTNGPRNDEAGGRGEDPRESRTTGDSDDLSRFASRVRWVATFTLALLMAAHTLMETGRDALFLTNIPVEHLPWVYILVAFSAVILARFVGRSRAGRRSLRGRLLLLQGLAATSVFAFWTGIGHAGPWLYYALYVWSGVISGIVVVTFWMLLGDVFTITQGKRVFASIAIGGSFGALAGSGLANVLAPTLGADSLLLASAAFFGASLLGPVWLARSEEPTAPHAPSMPVQPLASVGFREGLSRTLASPYACRIAILVALASATLTFSDYLFKSVLTEEVPIDQLSTWLARIYFGLNLASIAMLAIGVTPLVRRLGVDRSLAVLPAMIGLATLGVFAGMAFVGIIVIKASDGMLRYSLHKTASELLFLPMESSLRSAVKGVIDLVGDSTAKALASIVILGLVQLPQSRVGIGVGLLLLSGVWTLSALRLRRSYLDVFRETLQERSIDTRIEFPALDIDSIESLIQALSDPDERVVIAAMDLLMERGRCALIPNLILYHPSAKVVERAIDIFVQDRHAHVLDFLERLIDHERPAVRSAIVRAAALLAPDRARLEALSHSTCPCIRISAIGGLIANDWIEPEKARVEIETAVAHNEPDTRMATANAARLHYETLYRGPLCKLVRDPSPDVAREAVRAIRESDDPWFTQPLIGLLDDRRVRDEVRTALLERGEPALSLLGQALEAPETPAAIRRHLPRTISRFETTQAIDILLQGLRHVPSGMVRYKVLRGLQPLLHGPLGRSVDPAPLMAELEETLERSLFLLHCEAELARGQEERPARLTAGGRLLVDLLKDKRKLATGRIFMLLSLLYPAEDFRTIENGIRSDRPIERSSGTELLEHLLPHETSTTLLGILSPGAPIDRLRAAGSPRENQRLDYTQTIDELGRDTSQAVRAFALYHAGEIEFERMPDGREPGSRDEKEQGPSLRDRALEIIEGLPDALARQMLATDEPAGR